ncbi:uncharacterized protein LOC134696773 isoform X2 [Mytilus trossulus]|uniref:uncharacterized protein LOC134696773 isoform X2 n=1 Tax=Mytilus trossulus TaxID=6551 RepID=UPI00300794D5
MKHSFFDVVVFTVSCVLFDNIQAEICETSWIKHECYDQPCPGDIWYRTCNQCCKMNSTWFCVHDVYYHNCKATGHGSAITKRNFTDRPKDPYDNTEEYSSDSNKASIRIGVVGSIASGAIFTIVAIIIFVLLSRRRKSNQLRRNIPFIFANNQKGGNNGVSRSYPEYNVGADGGRTIPAYQPPVSTIACLLCTQNVTNDKLQNDSPPPYSECINHDRPNTVLSGPPYSEYI